MPHSLHSSARTKLIVSPSFLPLIARRRSPAVQKAKGPRALPLRASVSRVSWCRSSRRRQHAESETRAACTSFGDNNKSVQSQCSVYTGSAGASSTGSDRGPRGEGARDPGNEGDRGVMSLANRAKYGNAWANANWCLDTGLARGLNRAMSIVQFRMRLCSSARVSPGACDRAIETRTL